MNIIYGLAILIIILIIISLFPYRRATVFEYELGLKYKNGKFSGILAPGSYWCNKVIHLSAASTYNPAVYHRPQPASEKITIKKIDIRPAVITVPGQEVLSSDSISLKVSVMAKYEVTDPVTAINKVQNYQDALYSEIQLALREIIGTAKIDELLENRPSLNKQLLEICAPRAAELGLKLFSASIKDIMFPGELKQVFAQLVKAQKESLAVMERARGETAALRKLANAARMLEDNPALLQLRLAQSLGESKGNTLVFGMPPGPPSLFRKQPVNDAQSGQDSGDYPEETGDGE